MANVFSYLVARLGEPSTWAGIAAGAAAVGVSLQSNTGLYAALLSGLAAFLVPEKGGK
jgi:hypothetical protein